MKMKSTVCAIAAFCCLQTAYAFDAEKAHRELAEAKRLFSVADAVRNPTHAIAAKYLLITEQACFYPDPNYTREDGVERGAYFSTACAYASYRWFLVATNQISERNLLRFDDNDVLSWIETVRTSAKSSNEAWVVVK